VGFYRPRHGVEDAEPLAALSAVWCALSQRAHRPADLVIAHHPWLPVVPPTILNRHGDGSVSVDGIAENARRGSGGCSCAGDGRPARNTSRRGEEIK
jgi:hypothetical protein